jgi:hypothetical protein
MQHAVHDEVSLEMARRVAARLREQPALLQIAHDNLAPRLRQNADAPALVRCYREWQAIFLSYARGDDEPFVARLHADLTARGFDVGWDRLSMPARRESEITV